MTSLGRPSCTPVERGKCVTCGAWGWGPWVDDLTAHIALVLHCQPDPHHRDRVKLRSPSVSSRA